MQAIDTVEVCADCMFIHANGEVEGTPDCEPWGLLEDDIQATMGMAWEDHACDMSDTGGRCCDCDCETTEFSWNACDGCGSRLGGSRYTFTLWTKELSY